MCYINGSVSEHFCSSFSDCAIFIINIYLFIFTRRSSDYAACMSLSKTAAATEREPDRLQQLIQLLVGGNSFHMSRFTPLTRPFIHTGNHCFPVQLYCLATGLAEIFVLEHHVCVYIFFCMYIFCLSPCGKAIVNPVPLSATFYFSLSYIYCVQ